MNTVIIVPARLGSTRFPRKLLFPIAGKPLILWTAERIRAVAPGVPLWFAVAERELADLLAAHGFQSIMTDPALPSGTDRLAQANEQVGADSVINVQADEPLVHASHVAELARLISEPVDMATLAIRFRSAADFRDPNKVKVVMDRRGRALMFSRSPLPYCRDLRGEVDDSWLAANPAWLHLGMYAYKADFLRSFASLQATYLERTEKLEQLRALEHGFSIAVGATEAATVGIDVPEDAGRFEAALRVEGSLK